MEIILRNAVLRYLNPNAPWLPLSPAPPFQISEEEESGGKEADGHI